MRKIFEYYSTGLYSLSELVNLTKEWGLNNKKKPYKPLCKAQLEKILKNVFYCGYAKRNDEYYMHSYPVIVSTDLFMKCVAVREQRNKQYTRMTKHETIFKGFIKCANCGCTVTPDIKKGKYIYLKPNSKKGCNCKQINENVANNMVERVLEAITISKDTLQPYVDVLKTYFKESENIQVKEKLSYTKQLTTLTTRLDRLKKVYLDGDFTREEYLLEKQNIEIEQKTLENKIAELSTDNKEMEITLEYLLDFRDKYHTETDSLKSLHPTRTYMIPDLLKQALEQEQINHKIIEVPYQIKLPKNLTDLKNILSFIIDAPIERLHPKNLQALLADVERLGKDGMLHCKNNIFMIAKR